ncbi:MAG: cohesin domain-containing protein [bacterium]|nr:cohesin domain-containing protein [bacterium]
MNPRKKFNNFHILLSFSFFLLVFTFIPQKTFAQSAYFYLAPVAGNYNVGKNFSVNAMLGTKGVPANAAQAVISFPSEKIEVQSISKNNSIFTLWIQEPNWSNSKGEIYFGGGLPSPGYSGSSGKIITILFKAKAKGEAKVGFGKEIIAANDPWGTNIFSSSAGGSYSIFPSEVLPPALPKELPAVPETIKPITIPEITICPAVFLSGEEVLHIEGTSQPNYGIVAFLKSGDKLVNVWEATSSEMGEWFLGKESPLKQGIYKISVVAKNDQGVVSGPSKECTFRVILRGISIGPWIISYTIINLAGIVVLVIVLLWVFYLLWKIRRIKRSVRKESKDLKKKFYKEYDELHRDIIKELEELSRIRGRREITKEEAKREENLLNNLADVKQVLEKEIQDIDKGVE